MQKWITVPPNSTVIAPIIMPLQLAYGRLTVYVSPRFNSVTLKMANFEEKEHSEAIGKITTTKKEIFVAVKDGVLKIESLQFPGKKRMLAHELLNGVKLTENAIVL